MHQEHAYIQSCNLRWTVMLNDQFDFYVNAIQNGHLEHQPDCVSSAIVAG